MSTIQPLFEAQAIRLGAIDFEKDPEVESRWTHDAAYLRGLSGEAARPKSPEQVKKAYEKLEKRMDEKRDLIYFAIRSLNDDRLIGFARFFWLDWTHSSCMLQLGIGDAQDRHQGFGSQALNLMLNYAFYELNLYRVNVTVQAYNHPALSLFQRAGFVEEVRRRQALYQDGRYWDECLFSLYQHTWAAARLNPTLGEMEGA